MKAEELMIGDWVHVEAHRGFNAQNVKVETIPDNDGDYEYGHHYGHIGAWLESDDNDFRDVEAKHLRPIPLNPEILEKNGFFPKWRDNCLVEYLIYKDIVDGLHEMYVKITFFVGQDEHILDCFYVKTGGFHVWIKYVHQLQHALRLCGINHEIIL